jgi:hypothetical protein
LAQEKVLAGWPEQGRTSTKTKTSTTTILVEVLAMLATVLARIPGAKAFKAYDCNNASNPVEIYSLQELEPCPDVSPGHVV